MFLPWRPAACPQAPVLLGPLPAARAEGKRITENDSYAAGRGRAGDPLRIIRSAPSENGRFVAIPNSTVRDERLSYCARGILAELLSRPRDWQATADELWSEGRRHRPDGGEGRRTITAAFAELKEAGYLHAVRRQRSDGPASVRAGQCDRGPSRESGARALRTPGPGSGVSVSALTALTWVLYQEQDDPWEFFC